MACAAALASLDIYKEEGLFESAVESAKHMQEAAHSLKGTKNVIDIRNMGLIAAVEIEARQGAVGSRGFEAMKKAWELGVMIRANGDTIAFSPPLIVKNDQIDEMFDVTKKAIESLN